MVCDPDCGPPVHLHSAARILRDVHDRSRVVSVRRKFLSDVARFANAPLAAMGGALRDTTRPARSVRPGGCASLPAALAGEAARRHLVSPDSSPGPLDPGRT